MRFFLMLLLLAACRLPVASAADDCGGIQNGTIIKTPSDGWAHYAPNGTPESISLTAYNWEDFDEDESGGCNYDDNHWFEQDTDWASLPDIVGGVSTATGTCDPPEGVSTLWTPSVAQSGIQVECRLHDWLLPNDDSSKVEYVTVNAFFVYVDMTLTTTEGTSTARVVEGDPTQTLTKAMFARAVVNNWTSATGNSDDDPHYANVHYSFKAQPSGAPLNGRRISADVSTDSTCGYSIEVDDADTFDGPVVFSPGITVGSPVGISIGFTLTVGSDCAEAAGMAAIGYTADGWGTTESAALNQASAVSSVDTTDWPSNSDGCTVLTSTFVDWTWFDSVTKTGTLRASGPKAGTVIRDKGGDAQGQWDLNVISKTSGGQVGGFADSKTTNWSTTASLSSVTLVDP
tara:strand:+ start:13952 stop:15157 length:1206 start_codon:yes stop_codon:yes gene_type:complete